MFVISTTTNIKLVKMMGPMTLLHILIATTPLVSCIPQQHFVRRSMSPLSGITDMNATTILSLTLMEFLPLTHLVRSVLHLFLIDSISVSIDKFYAIQNGLPNGS